MTKIEFSADVTENNEDGIQKINTTYNALLPFVVSTEDATTYYIIRFQSTAGTYYWYSGEEVNGREKNNLNECTVSEAENYAFCIEGNWFDGFNIKGMNGKYLTAPNDSPENFNICTFSQEPLRDRSYFLLEKYDDSDEFRFRQKGANPDIWLAHTSYQDLNLTYYKDGNSTYGSGPNYIGNKVAFDLFNTNFNEELYTLAADIARPRVGYPAPDSDVATTLLAAIGDMTSYATFSTNFNADTYLSAKAAYESNTNVMMPEDGKAYYIHSIQQEGDGYLLTHTAEDQLMTKVYEANSNDDNDKFVCHRLSDGKYIFVSPVSGEYVCWRGYNAGYNNDKGFTDADKGYVSNFCNFTLESRAGNAPGTFTIMASRNENKPNEFVTFTVCSPKVKEDSNNAIKACDPGQMIANGNAVAWTSSYSNLFRLEEADYTYNNVTLNEADGANWATLYLPFSTVIPENVEAYTANLNDTGDKLTLTLSLVDGNTLPKATAVVLYSTTQTQAVFAPSTESGTAVENNALQGTMSTTQKRGENNIYALSGAFNEGIGFYPYIAETLPAGKAYIVLNGTSAPALLFDFGGEVTGIDAAATAAASDAPVYDLSGRRVAGTTKGLYIVGGKKVLVK